MNFLTSPLPQTSDLYSVTRLRFVQRIAMVSIAAALLGLFAILVSEVEPAEKIIQSFLTSLFPLLNVGLVIIARRGQVKLASTLIVVELLVATVLASTATLYWVVLTAIVAVTAAAILAEKWLFRVALIVVSIRLLLLVIVGTQIGASTNEIMSYLVLLATALIVGLTTRYFANQMQSAGVSTQNSNRLLQAAAETGQVISKVLTQNEIMPRAVELIQERFGYYHVQIFLVDEELNEAQLVASTGEVGRQLIARRHSLPVNSQSVIGRTTASGQAVIARNTDTAYFRNELLPNTRSELAVPIFDGERIIGALDIQSVEYENFGSEVMQALQVVANLLGTTIRNARLFEEQEKNSVAMRQLYLESESNLREIQRLNQQLTRSGWQEYLNSRRQVSGITLQSDEHPVMDSQWTGTLLKAGQLRKPVTEQRNEHGVIAVPMMLGNEVIGAIEVEAEDNIQRAEITELVNTVAQRLALSLDKARLFEESQETAAQEQRINEIVARFQTVNSVDDLLKITLEEVSQSLGAKRGTISLSSAAPVSGNGESQA